MFGKNQKMSLRKISSKSLRVTNRTKNKLLIYFLKIITKDFFYGFIKNYFIN